MVAGSLSIHAWFSPGSACGASEASRSARQAGGFTPDKIAILNALLLNDTDLTFTGVNVHIVNGLNGTEMTNGGGSLIIGYNEAGTTFTQARNGSHNLVVGQANNYTSYGGIVAGFNTTTAPYASVTGGQSNTANSGHTSVSGGRNFTENTDYGWKAGGASGIPFPTEGSFASD